MPKQTIRLPEENSQNKVIITEATSEKTLEEINIQNTESSLSLKTDKGLPVANTEGDIVDTKEGFRRLNLDVKNTLAQSFNDAVGNEYGDAVSAVFSRIFMWRIDLKSDVRKGDKITLVYRVIPEINQVDISVASYKSIKYGQTFYAYFFHPTNKSFPSFYDDTGEEISLTLKNAPIANYEQITALLKDRTRHKGMDFKSPVGTPVVTPFNGKVTRINWNSPNGNCVEVFYSEKNIVAKFLHLDKISPNISEGVEIKAGDKIGDSGNTGHSTAPHLHYQLEKENGTVIDPVDFHETYHEKIPSSLIPTFFQKRDALKKLLG